MLVAAEFGPSLDRIKKLCDWDSFKKEQKWIIYVIAEENYTWKKISDEYRAAKGVALNPNALVTCLIRSSLSQTWEKGTHYGNDPYLCDADMKTSITAEWQQHKLDLSQ